MRQVADMISNFCYVMFNLYYFVCRYYDVYLKYTLYVVNKGKVKV